MAILVKRISAVGDVGNTVNKVTILRDVKSNNTVGDSLSVGSYGARILNTLTGNTSFCTLSGGSLGTDGTANQFQLATGTYIIEAKSMGLTQSGVGSEFKIKLRNITDNSDAIIGTSANDANPGATGNSDTLSVFLEDAITIAAPKVFQVQMRSTTTAVGGSPANFGDVEIYTQVRITKVETINEAY